MPNSYFQFKQFRIEQGQTAMKVTTEACILGAWTASLELNPNSILDIGTGTGLLSLMLAQGYDDTLIHAIEIEEAAANQAKQNFQFSPWKDRVKLIRGDVIEYSASTDQSYDLIVSNPPFFASHKITGKADKDQAIHQSTLTQIQLLETVDRLLDTRGHFVVLFPIYEAFQLAEKAQDYGLYPGCELMIQDRTMKSPFRMIQIFQRNPQPEINTDTLIIKNGNGDYTSAFTDLLKSYYLYL